MQCTDAHSHTHTLYIYGLYMVCCRQVLLPNRRLQTQWRGKKVCFGAHLVCIMWIIKVSQGNSNTFCLKNLKRASFYKTSRKIMVHIFVYQRMVQDIEMPGTGTDDSTPCWFHPQQSSQHTVESQSFFFQAPVKSSKRFVPIPDV